MTRIRLLLALLGVVALASLVPASAPAQQAGDAAVADVDPTAPDQVELRRKALAAELQAADEAIAQVPEERRPGLVERRDWLFRIAGLLDTQADLAASPETADPDAPAPPEEQPPSIFALNRLYDALEDRARYRERSVEAVAAARAALETAKRELAEAETKRREARTRLEETEGDPSAAEQRLELRRLASRAAAERVHLRKLELRRAERYEAAADQDPGVEARIAQLREALADGGGSPAAGFAALGEVEQEARHERSIAERTLSTTELRIEAAKLRMARESDPAGAALEEADALAAQREILRRRLVLIDARLERIAAERETWRRWQAVARGEGTRAELETWKDRVVERIDVLEQARDERGAQQLELERRQRTLRDDMGALPEGTRIQGAIAEHHSVLTELLDDLRAEAARTDHELRVSRRLLRDLRERTGETDLSLWLARLGAGALAVWSYEITVVDDSPITVGSLLLTLLFAAAGLWASRRGSALIGQVARRRFHLDTGAVHAMENLSFYILLVSFGILVLRAVHFPLTAFTVLGGALAIGLGFGSQNVMNNFISGLILMLERPVRAGDVIEVDGNFGSIERIGARSTQIRSTDGRHIVVPNSFFLESNVVNWTLSDDLVRTSVVVGVIYGSPTRLVEQLIRQAVDEDERVLKSPDPIIVFDEFGDNSLNFVVHFWVRARSPMDLRRVQSGVRFRIDDLFRENGLVIAFPQRDVHLDSVSPIEVRVLPEAES